MNLRPLAAGLLLTPLLWAAAVVPARAQSMFDQFFDNAYELTRRPQIPGNKIIDFAVHEMEDWKGDGVLIYPSDVEAAITGDVFVLCSDKLSFHSLKPLEFDVGGLEQNGGCKALQSAIMSVVDTEMDIEKLGDMLTTVANGGMLAEADQPNRPANVGFATLLTTRIWTATGTTILAWPDAANDIITDKLDKEMAEDGVSDELLWKYQNGYFRNDREADPVVSSWNLDGDNDGYTVGMALKEVADALNIKASYYKKTGEFVVPKLQAKNVGLWARADDIGLMWIYPDHFTRMKEIKEADDYPEYKNGGDQLAYPWTYAGNANFSGMPEIKSPLCSRSAGRLGYLCRNVPEPVENCANPDNENDMNLIRCDEQERTTVDGPEICPEITALFKDDGTPLWDPSDPRFLNPALSPADVNHICDPENRVMYKDEIEAHACYIAYCVAQSHSGHTLVSNRSPNVVGEATSPYLACMRQDPHLGLYAELAQMTPFALPSYIGHSLAQEYEREYCAITGLPPHPLAGFCQYRENRRANSPLYTLGSTTDNAKDELENVREDQSIYLGDAVAIGQRMALDQWLPVQKKMVATIAQSIDETATLLRELARAPLTKTPCPWTGPFPRSSASNNP
ncbi:MAG TPA: hypothetical protein PKV72_00015 [Candidatus Peribacteria bacterium]|nr:hypothetical protein [Candidatus Peribacteria bacterium]